MLLFKGIEFAQALHEIHSQSFDKPWSLENFQNILKLSSTFGFCQNEGFILCSDLGDSIEILTFAVLKTARRKGIGTQLMAQVQNFAINHHKKHIFLEVNITNKPAISLYQKCGFIQTGTRKNYYHEQGKIFDALCFTWKNPQLNVGD